ncbi:unnamed protein product [Scytosiphon promiscuus]
MLCKRARVRQAEAPRAKRVRSTTFMAVLLILFSWTPLGSTQWTADKKAQLRETPGFAVEEARQGYVEVAAESEGGAIIREDEAGIQGEGPFRIKYVSLIAERHSGSTWMTTFLKSYFRDSDVTVTATLCTWKHWFQDRIHRDIQDGKRPCRDRQQCPACLDVEHTLVIVIWRNPYDWISGMQDNPHHAKAHSGIKDLSEFMTMPWIMDETHEQLARQDALQKAEDQEHCIDNFLPGEVLPCKALDASSIYELDPNGLAYGNIYELRKAKIRDFNAVETWAPFYEKILYEDMLVGNGLRDWIESLDTRYGLRGRDMEIPDLGLSLRMENSRNSMYYMNSEHCAPNCTMGGTAGIHAVETLHNMWDEELEGGLGYHKVDALSGRT